MSFVDARRLDAFDYDEREDSLSMPPDEVYDLGHDDERPVAITRCPTCGLPSHACESDDLGRCAPCAAVAGEPHAPGEP